MAYVSYFMTDPQGASIDRPDDGTIREILTALRSEAATEEEPSDVTLVHESGWSLSVFADRSVMWEDVQTPATSPYEVTFGTWEAILEVLRTLARGDVQDVVRQLNAADG